MFQEQPDPPQINSKEDLMKAQDEEEDEAKKPKRPPRSSRVLFGRRSGRVVSQHGPLVDKFGGPVAPFDPRRHRD